MNISSPAFSPGERIPEGYTCDGNRLLPPPLLFSDIPSGAKSLALIMDDPDVPKVLREDGLFTHWVLFNIPPETREIPEGRNIGTPGANTRGAAAYTGPCPPAEYEPRTHRYFFKLYALDTLLDLPEGASREDVERAMQPHVLTEASMHGVYARK